MELLLSRKEKYEAAAGKCTRHEELRMRLKNLYGRKTAELVEIIKGRHEEDGLAVSRWLWENSYAKSFGSFEDTTVVPPMRFTFGPVPTSAAPDYTLQIFSVKVEELKDTSDLELKNKSDLRWLLQVYGFIAVRDSVDPKTQPSFPKR